MVVCMCGCREQRMCTAACCRDDLSENSSTRTSSHSSRTSRVSHRVQVEFNEEENDTNGSNLDFYEAKVVIVLTCSDIIVGDFTTIVI